MASIRVRGAACVAFLSFAVAAPAVAQERSPAAALWQLRSGLNVAALACRGADEGAIVAGYNRLLADHKAELAATYRVVAAEHGSDAAMDAAMTRLYNGYAQPAAQAALCENAGAVLAALGQEPTAPLGPLAEMALALLEPAPARLSAPVTQLAVASIPQILDQRMTEPGEE